MIFNSDIIVLFIYSAWSNEGCSVFDTNKTHTICTCHHLTNFAILMDVHDVPLTDGQDRALQIMTYIGCTISVVCLFLAILTFQLFRGLKVTIISLPSLDDMLLIPEIKNFKTKKKEFKNFNTFSV